VHCAIDTGATRSFIGRELSNRIATLGTRKRAAEAIRLADGTNRTVTEALEVPIQLGTLTKQLRC